MYIDYTWIGNDSIKLVYMCYGETINHCKNHGVHYKGLCSFMELYIE